MTQSIQDMISPPDGYVDDPLTTTPRIGWLIGASFTFTGTNWAAEGPRLGQWLGYLAAGANDCLVVDGKPGDTAQDHVDSAQYQIDADTAAGVLDQLVDYAILEFTGDALTNAANGITTAIPILEQALVIMTPKAKKMYALRYPPYTADMDIPYFDTLGLTPAEWSTWNNAYEAMLATHPEVELIDAHYDWVPSGRPAPSLDPDPDYHISSQSAYRAATRVYARVTGDYT